MAKIFAENITKTFKIRNNGRKNENETIAMDNLSLVESSVFERRFCLSDKS